MTIIAAIGKNNELGFHGDLIWRIPEDLKFFRATTVGHYIVMGRKTFESISKDLKNRRYIVISRTLDAATVSPDVTVCYDIGDFLEFAKSINDTIYVIGGGEIYRELLPHCDTLIMTEIDATAPADTYFPTFNRADYKQTSGEPQTHNGISYRRNIYTRV